MSILWICRTLPARMPRLRTLRAPGAAFPATRTSSAPAASRGRGRRARAATSGGRTALRARCVKEAAAARLPRSSQRIGTRQFALKDSNFAGLRLRRRNERKSAQQPPVRAGPNQHPNVMSGLMQPPRQRAADKAIGACDEDFHVRGRPEKGVWAKNGAALCPVWLSKANFRKYRREREGRRAENDEGAHPEEVRTAPSLELCCRMKSAAYDFRPQRFFSSSALSVYSHVHSGIFRPKCP